MRDPSPFHKPKERKGKENTGAVTLFGMSFKIWFSSRPNLSPREPACQDAPSLDVEGLGERGLGEVDGGLGEGERLKDGERLGGEPSTLRDSLCAGSDGLVCGDS